MAEYRVIFGPHDGQVVNINVPLLVLPRMDPPLTIGDCGVPLWKQMRDDRYVRTRNYLGDILYVYEPVYQQRMKKEANVGGWSDNAVKVLRERVKELEAENAELRLIAEESAQLMNVGTEQLLQAAQVIDYERRAKQTFRDGFTEAVKVLSDIAVGTNFTPGTDTPWASLPDHLTKRLRQMNDMIEEQREQLMGLRQGDLLPYQQKIVDSAYTSQQARDYAPADKGSWPVEDRGLDRLDPLWLGAARVRAWFRRLLGVNSPYNNG